MIKTASIIPTPAMRRTEDCAENQQQQIDFNCLSVSRLRTQGSANKKGWHVANLFQFACINLLYYMRSRVLIPSSDKPCLMVFAVNAASFKRLCFTCSSSATRIGQAS